uniref:EF-hand domain-containing protein n=1 Tax=Pyrodinium bahamense TaxID=73915 RepID=A0A7S0BAY8_9DINO
MMNLITAILLEEAISSARMDEEMEAFFVRQKLRKMQPQFRQVFRLLDISGDGKVQIDELTRAMKRGVGVPPELRGIADVPRMIDLFDVLDFDGSGELSEAEFVDGMCQMAVSHVPVETVQILHLVRSFRREVLQALDAEPRRCTGPPLGAQPSLPVLPPADAQPPSLVDSALPSPRPSLPVTESGQDTAEHIP